MTKGKAAPFAAAADTGAPLTITLDLETLAALDRLRGEFGETREHLVTTAVLRFVHEETIFEDMPDLADIPFADVQPELSALDAAHEAMIAFIKEGEDSIARGEVISHEELMAELRALDDEAKARKNAA